MKKLNFYISHIIIFMLVIISSACEKAPLFNGGEETSFLIELEDFYILEIHDIFEITLHNSDENYLYVHAGENLIQKLDFQVKDGKLYMKDGNKYSWSRNYEKIKIDLYTSDLSRINIRSSVLINTSTSFHAETLAITDYEKFSEVDMEIQVNSFRFFVSSDNAGIYTFRGTASSAFIRPWGSCFVYANDLKIARANVNHSSIGDAHLFITEELKVSMDEKGRLYYRGNPNVVIEKNTAGAIIALP